MKRRSRSARPLTGIEWAKLLCSQPVFADRCDWSTFDADAWHCLLSKRPEFADRFDWSIAKQWNRWYWVMLLYKQPRFADKCDIWDEFDGIDHHWLGNVRRPERVPEQKEGNVHSPSAEEKKPQPAKRPDGVIQALILKMDPSGASLGGFDHFSGKNWIDFLLAAPTIPESVLGQCKWSKLDGGNWAAVLSGKPELSGQCDWEKLDGGNWAELLRKQPQFADKCDWAKLDGWNWADLLDKQPQFADRCDWSKFDGNDSCWQELLFSRPEFKERFESCTGRKYEELDMDNFVPRSLW